ncbi:MAG: hypothetical protein IT273_12720 [Chitinophagales bacterium]|nr:hypothetical protein [Chitinophagales bacterium]
MLRGGSWNNNAVNCRLANRNNNTPANHNNNYGFRLALPSSTKQTDGCPAVSSDVFLPLCFQARAKCFF